jgi:hypothetical protein
MIDVGCTSKELTTVLENPGISPAEEDRVFTKLSLNRNFCAVPVVVHSRAMLCDGVCKPVSESDALPASDRVGDWSPWLPLSTGVDEETTPLSAVDVGLPDTTLLLLIGSGIGEAEARTDDSKPLLDMAVGFAATTLEISLLIDWGIPEADPSTDETKDSKPFVGSAVSPTDARLEMSLLIEAGSPDADTRMMEESKDSTPLLDMAVGLTATSLDISLLIETRISIADAMTDEIRDSNPLLGRVV